MTFANRVTRLSSPMLGVLLLGAATAARAELPPAANEATPQSSAEGNVDSTATTFWANYYGVFFGPSVDDPRASQVSSEGKVDKTKPLLVKNFLTGGYNITDNFSAAATAYFEWIPVQGQAVTLMDPQVRVACNSIIYANGFNWYADIRANFPVSDVSRRQDLLASFQNFHAFSFTPTGSRWTFLTYASAVYGFFGKQGSGNDLYLWVAPALNYQVTPGFMLTAMYEMSAVHPFGNDPGNLYNDGTDFQPGFAWEVVHNLTWNPYLNITTGDRVSWKTTSVGMTLSWIML